MKITACLTTMPALLIAAVLLSGGCKAGKNEKQDVATVKTEEAAVYGEDAVVTFPGKIRAASDVNLAFRVSGTILRVPVKEGAHVKKGDLLAEIDPRDYEIQLSATEAEYNRIKGEAERIIELYKRGSVSRNEYDKAVYGLQQISAKYDAHKNALADTRLTAPFDGYVQKRYYDKDETVSAGMPVVSLINTALPEVEINIPATDYVKRDLFGSFSCKTDIYPDREFPLELVGIARKANLNQLYNMRLRLKEAVGKEIPAPGMTAIVTIRYKSQESEMTRIPLSALFGQEETSSVWVYDPHSGTVSKRDVTPLKLMLDGTVVLSGGLKAGEKVVTAGIHSLSDGQPVRLLEKPSVTNIGGML